MKRIATALILWGALSWSDAMAQTHEQGHKHEQHEKVKDAPPKEGATIKGETKEKMKQRMKDMKCCSKDEQKESKS